LPATNKIIKENLHRVIYVGSEDRALVPMVPLITKDRKSENYTIFRNLDDFSLHMVKNNDSKTVIKTCSFIPTISQEILEGLDNLALGEKYHKETFIKRHLLPILYPDSLIDPNHRPSQNKPAPSVELDMLEEEKSVNKNSRCKTCNYIIHNFEFQKCSKCNEAYHDHCVKKNNVSARSIKGSEKGKKWICDSCKNCTYCLSGSSRDSLVNL
jgi:hypothetical protein